MKRMLMVLGIAGIAAVSAVGAASAEDSTGAGQPSDNANYLAIERATRNSDGGDREHGGFGLEQSAKVQAEQPYGQWLKDWKAEHNG